MPSTPTTTVPLRLTADRRGDVLVLLAEGDLDAATAPGLVAAVAATVDADDREVHVDLAGVAFLDTAGVDALARCRRELAARSAATLRVVRPSDAARLVLSLAGAATLLD